MTEEAATPPSELMRATLRYMESRAIHVVAKLGLADLMRDGPKTADDLAAETGTNADALHRVLRLLVSAGVLTHDPETGFALTEIGQCLRSDHENSMRNYVLYAHDVVFRVTQDLMPSVETGLPSAKDKLGAPMFEWVGQNPEAAKLLHAGLAERSQIETAAILEAYDFAECGRIVDVGGGNGAFLSAILSEYPETSGILFELEHAIEAARKDGGGRLSECELVPGDFFKSVPEGGDTYILKTILHDWRDDDALRILRTCRDAMKEGARLLIIEGLVGAPGSGSLIEMIDIIMLTLFHGRERTVDEFARLLRETRFRVENVVRSTSPLHVLEAVAV